MILFFTKCTPDSDAYVKFCYAHYRDIMAAQGIDVPAEVNVIRDGGKPKFDTDKAHFNLSHSDGVTVLGISHAELGVDIQKYRDVDYKKFDFISAENSRDFIEKWTERESYVKMTGRGLADIRKPIPDGVGFEHFDVFDDYHVSVCSEPQNIIAYQIDPNAIK